MEWLQKELIRVLREYREISLSINFSPSQLLYPETKQFFKEMNMFSNRLLVKITEDPILLDITEEISGKNMEESIIATLTFIKKQGYEHKQVSKRFNSYATGLILNFSYVMGHGIVLYLVYLP